MIADEGFFINKDFPVLKIGKARIGTGKEFQYFETYTVCWARLVSIQQK